MRLSVFTGVPVFMIGQSSEINIPNICQPATKSSDDHPIYPRCYVQIELKFIGYVPDNRFLSV